MTFVFDHYCPQLFFLRKNSSGPPEPLASAVLVNISGYFLITASHVFENKSIDEIIIFTDTDSIVRLYGDLGFYLPVAGKDNIDIAILRLPDSLVRDLSQRYEFLHYKNIAFTGVSPEVKQYLFYGFIANQTELKNKVFESNQFGLLTIRKEIPRNDPSGFSDKENIWLAYNRRKQSFIDSSSRNIGPKDLRGLSGGGVWAVIRPETHPGRRFYLLAGIMIEQRIDKGYIIASKMGMLIGILHQRFGISPANYFHLG